MKAIKIFYFSGTGNTWWVSRNLAGHLNKKGMSASIFSIEKLTCSQGDELIEEADLVGFGYPVYGSDVPDTMKDFIMGLSPVNNKKGFVYCTQWMWSGDGAREGAEFLVRKGFNIGWGGAFFNA